VKTDTSMEIQLNHVTSPHRDITLRKYRNVTNQPPGRTN